MEIHEDPQRPAPVTVIGWLWLVLGALSFGRSVVILILWRAVQPALPTLLDLGARRAPETRYFAFLFAHFMTIQLIQAALSILLAIAAWQFLRLRPWARVTVRVVCGLALAYVLAFMVFWAVVWTREFSRPSSSLPPAHLPPAGTLVAGVAVCLALAVGLGAMVVALGREQVRAAFRSRVGDGPS